MESCKKVYTNGSIQASWSRRTGSSGRTTGGGKCSMVGEREGQIIAEVVRRAGTHPRRTEAAPPARGSDHPLPAQPTALLGRDAELDELSQALLSGMVRLLTLTGPAGVGKTRLGIELA